MPNRVVYESVLTSQSLARLSPEAERMFIRSILMADDRGCFEATPAVVRGRAFPHFDILMKDVENWQGQLELAKVGKYWRTGDRVWGWLPAWSKHNSSYCLTDDGKNTKHRPKTPEPPQSIIDCKSTSIFSGCKNGEPALASNSQHSPDPDPDPDPDPEVKHTLVSLSAAERSVFEHWKKVMGKEKSAVDGKRRAAIKRGLTLGAAFGDPVVACCNAIDGCKASSFHQGKNEGGKKYDGIELIFRDADHFERFYHQTAEPVTGTQHADVMLAKGDAIKKAHAEATAIAVQGSEAKKKINEILKNIGGSLK